MRRSLWWILSGMMLVIFLPLGILLLAVTLVKELGNSFEETQEEPKQDIAETEYFKNTLEKYR